MFRSLLWRFALPLLALVSLGAWLVTPYVDRVLTEWFRRDVELRAQLVMASIEDSLEELVDRPQPQRLARFVARVTTDERLVAVLVCRPDGRTIHASSPLPEGVSCALATLPGDQRMQILRTPRGPLHVSRFDRDTTPAGGADANGAGANGAGADGAGASPAPVPFRTLIVHDLAFVERRSGAARNYVIAFAALSALAVVLVTVAIAWLMLRSWVGALVRDIRVQRFSGGASSRRGALPVLAQVRQTLRELEAAQRLEIDYRENWTPQALRHVVKDVLESPQIVVVSNREPYIHARDADGVIRVQVPASGMVTALEPVMRACSGTWVAHGSGPADREVVDAHDRVQVPPAEPAYALRRVWLTPEEEEGYYYGFSNEGLWPLCHIAYVRPAFRPSDWEHYREVNRRFAQACAEEARSDAPVILVQDYHFAMLPATLRELRPRATIALFWHIPWPNAETFGTCPWARELLTGMLAADVLGFHTRYHCQNFLATVDRYVECQIDHEHMTVTVRGHVCHVAAYPISIAWPHPLERVVPPAPQCRARVRERFGIGEGVAIGVGVERWDFTKGIVERLEAMEALLERRPDLRGRVTLLQVAAPTRSKLPAYRALQDASRAAAARLNDRFATGSWRPVVLIAEHQEPEQVFELLRSADFCIVNSLHDGMNLVAKEFVAARDDEDGVLVLSTFAGASRELTEALQVNPYDVAETAAAIERALAMPREERRQRMRLMRRTVQDNNVYRWAGRMLMDAARIRQQRALGLAR